VLNNFGVKEIGHPLSGGGAITGGNLQISIGLEGMKKKKQKD